MIRNSQRVLIHGSLPGDGFELAPHNELELRKQFPAILWKLYTLIICIKGNRISAECGSCSHETFYTRKSSLSKYTR